MHILFQKAAYTDTMGLPIACSGSKTKIEDHIKDKYHKYKLTDNNIWDNPDDSQILVLRNFPNFTHLRFDHDPISVPILDAPRYIVRKIDDENLYWADDLGWVERKRCQYFSEEYMENFNEMFECNNPTGAIWMKV